MANFAPMNQMEKAWKQYLGSELEMPYMKDLGQFIESERSAGKIIYPEESEVFSAFSATPFDKVKVVIIGQDPYHGAGQAHGMCFSVKKGVRPPPSLKNIYKELKSDLDIEPPEHGYLMDWAREGVLLLNSVLTVEDSKAGSHQKKGWEKFTDKVIDILNSEKEGLVFILWGAPAQKKAARVDASKHHIIKSVHPSPLAAHRGFFGTKPFSKTNEYLISRGLAPINWKINP